MDHRGKWILAAGMAVFVAALGGLLLTGHDTIAPSADSDAGTAVWAGLAIAAATVVLVRLIPPRAPELMLPSPGPSREWKVLVSIAIVFPLIGFGIALAGADKATVGAIQSLGKPFWFLLLPWLILRWFADRRPLLLAPQGESAWAPRGSWRWLAPIPALALFAVLRLLIEPLPNGSDYPDLVELIIRASFTVITANLLEEIFYRVMLQTRLEQVVGRWPAIFASALLFAFMHLPSHAQGTSALSHLPLTLGAIVVAQGAFGLVSGYLWSRYRNLWVIFGAHTIVNTLPLFFMT